MTTSNTQVTTTVQAEADREDGFHEFAMTLSQRAAELIDNHLTLDPDPCLVKLDKSVYDAYLSGFSEEIRQQYTCRTCEAFLNSIGSWALITKDYQLLPFIFTTGDDSWVPERFKQPYANIVALFKDTRSPISIIQKSSLENLLDKITVEERGGFSHFHIPKPAAGPLLATLKGNLPEQGEGIHAGGLGRAERETLHNAFQFFSDLLYNKPKPVPLESLTVNDRKQFELLNKFVTEYNTAPSKNLYVNRYLAKLGLSFVSFKSTALGQLLTDISNGMLIKDALDRYNRFTNPLVYKRPVNLPSEKEFAASVEYLNDNGYTALLARRMAVWEDLLEAGMIAWERPKDGSDEQSDAFAALRKQVQQSDPAAKVDEPKVLASEDVSLAWFTGWLKEQVASENVQSIRYSGAGFDLGTAIATNDDQGKIYVNDQKVFSLFFNEPVSSSKASRVVNGKGWDSHRHILTADGLTFTTTSRGDALPVLLLNNSGIAMDVPNLFSIDDLQDHLKPHFRTIYKYGMTDILNHVDGKLAEYNDGVVYFVVNARGTNAISVTTKDNTTYTFVIKTQR